MKPIGLRRGIMTLVAFSLVGGVTIPLAAQCGAGPGYRILGSVVSARDGSALAHARLSLRPAGRVVQARRRPDSGASPISVEADESGHFSLQPPTAGAWAVSAQALGYRQQLYLQHENFSSAVVLTQAAPCVSLTFPLDPDGVVTGVVLDEAGEPVRRATVQAVPVRSPLDELRSGFRGPREVALTDDRGRYAVSGLAPGSYRLSVQAQPWYARAARSAAALAGDAPSSLPSLDMVYAVTWFPGVDTERAADILTLKAGEVREADVALRPIPSSHLVIGSPIAHTGADNRSVPSVQMERLGSSGFGAAPIQTMLSRTGQLEVNGLAPGLYRLQTEGTTSGSSDVSFLRAEGGAPPTQVPAAHIHVSLTGTEETENLRVVLTDPATGDVFGSEASMGGFRRRGSADSRVDRTLDVPAGQYQVVVAASRDEGSLRSVTLNGRVEKGRLVEIPSGDSSLLLTMVAGRAQVHGVATVAGAPTVGAMVLLVPATFGDPSSLTLLQRDQTNTDGSFDLQGIIPGEYILAVIDRGWSVNFHDPATLERYLLHGTPLLLKPGDDLRQDAVVQQP